MWMTAITTSNVKMVSGNPAFIIVAAGLSPSSQTMYFCHARHLPSPQVSYTAGYHEGVSINTPPHNQASCGVENLMTRQYID